MKNSLITAAFIILVSPLLAQTSEVFTTGEGAIGGYDPVAYFKEGKPVKGSKAYVYNWHGATWAFASANNLDAFKNDPEKYAPQYGGFCAYGTAEGHKAPTQPDAWTIDHDKLYFNYNKDVQQAWRRDQPNLIKKADAHWPEVKVKNDK